MNTDAAAVRPTWPKVARIRRRLEFLELQKSGRRIPGTRFLFVYDDSRRGATSRLGVTVTKKVGIAVVRNRLKRAVREAFRHERAGLAGRLRLVVIAREAAARSSGAELRSELAELFARLRQRTGGPG